MVLQYRIYLIFLQVDENYEYKAKYNSKFNILECCSPYFEQNIFILRCCEESGNFFTPTSLLLHWNIMCKNDEVWNKLYYEEGDDDDPIPISELERKRFSRKARTKRIEAFHEVNHTKHRKSSRKSECEDDNGKIHINTTKKKYKQITYDNNETDEDEAIIKSPKKQEIEVKTKEDNNFSDSEDEDVKIEVIRNKLKSPSLSSEDSSKKKRKYKTKKNEEDEEDEYIEHNDNIYGDIDDEEEGLEGLEMEEEEEDDKEEYAIKRKSNSNINRKSKKSKKQHFNYSDDSDKDEYEYNEIKSNNKINNKVKNENNHHNHKKKKYFNQKKTIGVDKSEYKICTETIFDRKSLELYLLNHVIRAYVVEKLKESERKSKKRQTFTSILAE